MRKSEGDRPVDLDGLAQTLRELNRQHGIISPWGWDAVERTSIGGIDITMGNGPQRIAEIRHFTFIYRTSRVLLRDGHGLRTEKVSEGG